MHKGLLSSFLGDSKPCYFFIFKTLCCIFLTFYISPIVFTWNVVSKVGICTISWIFFLAFCSGCSKFYPYPNVINCYLRLRIFQAPIFSFQSQIILCKALKTNHSLSVWGNNNICSLLHFSNFTHLISITSWIHSRMVCIT